MSQSTATLAGWHLVKSGERWQARYFQDGRAYLCDPEDYQRHCRDNRIECHFNVIVVGPDSLYSEAVKLKPPVIRKYNPRCPYPDIHADDCTCDGAGGAR